MANGYLGSSQVLVSVGGKNIIDDKPSNWTHDYKLKKFSFNNEQNCTVKINNQTTLFLKAGQGFEVDKGDFPITSFIIVEAEISYNWIGMF